jgi:hypothetical protein
MSPQYPRLHDPGITVGQPNVNVFAMRLAIVRKPPAAERVLLVALVTMLMQGEVRDKRLDSVSDGVEESLYVGQKQGMHLVHYSRILRIEAGRLTEAVERCCALSH